MRINLLPGRMAGKQATRVAWAIVALILVAELVGLSLWQNSLIARERQMSTDVTTAEAAAQKVNELDTKKQLVLAEIGPIQAKATFVKDLTTYNEQRPNLYETTAEYTLSGVKYTSMNAADNVIQMAAWAPSLADAGRYLLAIQNDPDFSLVRISGVPGYPPGTQGSSSSGGFGDIGGGAPGMPGGSGGPAMGGSGGPAMGGQGPAFAGPPGGSGGPSSGMAPGMPGGSGGPGGGASFGPGGPGGPGGGFGGGGGGGGGGSGLMGGAYLGLRDRAIPVRGNQQFQFGVTAVLVKPIIRPVPFGGGQQQGGGGFGGPSGGMGPEAGMPGGAAGMGPEAGMPGGPGGSAGMGMRRRGGAGMAE